MDNRIDEYLEKLDDAITLAAEIDAAVNTLDEAYHDFPEIIEITAKVRSILAMVSP